MKDKEKNFLDEVSDFSFSSGHRMFHSAPYWIAALTVGIFAVGYAKLFAVAEQVSKRLFNANPVLFALIAPVFFIAAWALVHFFAPKARGSGIPQVMTSVELGRGEAKEKYLGLRLSLIKIVSSVCCVIGGGAIGREGPTLQVSASIFHFFGTKFEKYFNFKLSADIWIITGAAAGLSAAFNTPLGGLVYAIEELSRSHLNSLKTPLISAVIISGLASQMLSGPYLYIGLPELLPLNNLAYFYLILISFICGISGSFFGKILYKLSKWVQSLKDTRKVILVCVGCSVAISLFALKFDSRVLGSGKDTMVELLFSNNSDKSKLLMLAIGRFVAPVLTYITGVAGGIFAPSLSAGACIGAWLADVFGIYNHNLIVMAGMIAFLTGVTRTPFTAFVLVLEMTNRHSAIFPMMIAAWIASIVAPLVDSHSVYEHIREDYLAFERS